MQYFLAVLASFFAVSAAVPLLPRAAEMANATEILQYALTLEHLEATFYASGLAKYDNAAFTKAGFPSWVRGRFAQISQHEAGHVDFLTKALGNESVAACNYSFPHTDPASFAALAGILEGVGTSAYLGAAHFLTDTTLTEAGSILATEARHAAWLHSAVLKQEPWSGAYETPLDLRQVFSLAVPFITSCPSSNPALPLMAFPTLKFTGPKNGAVTLDYQTNQTGDAFLALFTGVNTLFAPIVNKTAKLPSNLQGTVYAVVSSNGSAVSDDTTLAGPAIMQFPFGADAKNP
ncbi:unnamed protein product [Mycena citricolor]|nr:unnamed protein product [Mycena citricolor]